MKWFASCAAALAVGFTLVAGDLQARPGGGLRGGGRVAPSVRGGGGPVANNAAPTQRDNAERTGARQQTELPSPTSQAAQNRQANPTNRAGTGDTLAHTQAFTPAWYAQHPQAWQFTHPHADAWVATSFATAAAWLGWNAVQSSSSGGAIYDPSSDTVQPEPDAALPPAGAGPPAGASNDWLPLGVYALVRPGQSQGTSLLQLAVNKEGAVRGTYYDEISDSSHILQGSVNTQNQMVDWTVGQSGRVTFQAGLDDLTQSSTPVALQFPGGRVAYATLLRQSAGESK
jgi:hypothetical protein